MKTNTLDRWNKLILAIAASLALMLTISAGTLTAEAVPLPGPEGAIVEVRSQSGNTIWNDSLQDAVTTAQDGDTVRLRMDVTLTETLMVQNSDADFTLDLNGHTLSTGEGVNYALQLGGGGYKPTLTLMDSLHSDNGRITSTDSSERYPAVVVGEGNLIICDGAIVAGIGDVVAVNGGKLTVKDGGIIESNSGMAITAKDPNSEVSIEGGYIKKNILEGPVVEFMTGKGIAVTGGKFEGRLVSIIPGFITGGSFTEEPQEDYIADGYMAIADPEGTGLFIVVKENNTVAFDLQGHAGTEPASQEIPRGGRVTKPGLVVSGTEAVDKWYKDPECTEEWDFNTPVTEGMTLYAKWQHYHDGIVFDDWTDAYSLPDTSGNYVLKNNVELSSSWVVPRGEVKLCLNGKTIRITAKDAPVIRVGAYEGIASGVTLKVYDDTGEGKITGANNTNDYPDDWDNGGGVNVAGSNVFELYGGNITGNYAYYGGGIDVMGTFNMYGGSIKGNTGEDGAGVYLMGPRGSVYKPVFNMHGGEIDGNVADAYGGGVYIDSASTFNMLDGKITDNAAESERGGGVYVNYSSAAGTAFNLYGAEITGNTASDYAGGIYVSLGNNVTFNIGGIGGEAPEMKTITVAGNKLSNGKAADIFMHRPVNILSKLTEDTGIGLRTFIDETDALTSGLAGNGSLENFFSDREFDPENFPRILAEDENGEVVYKDAYQITLDPGEGSGSCDPVVVPCDEDYELPDNPFTEPSYKKFNGWKVGSDETIHEAGYVVPRENVTVTAQWAYRKHFVVFEAHGGSGDMEDLARNEGSEYELPECGYTPPSNKIFKEWSVKIGSGSFVSKQPGDIIKITDDVTIRAEWLDHSEHTWDEGVITTPATCSAEGEKLFTCTGCGETKTEPVQIDPDAHAWDEGEITTPATCGAEGVKTFTCTIDPEHKRTEPVAIDPDAHVWGEWVITKEATETSDGSKTRTCSGCGKTETEAIPAKGYKPGTDPAQKGADGTPAGAGASEACVDNAVRTAASEEGPAGTKFAPLMLKSTKQTKTSVKLTWSGAAGATRYIVYGAASGKQYRMVRIGETGGKAFTASNVGKPLKKGAYHKFIVVALDENNNVVSTSKVAHAATKGGKVKNPGKVTVSKSVVKKAKKLKAGKSLKLKAKQTGSKVKKRRALSYESSNPAIATVSKKGVVKGKAKGTCYVYAYAQNGVFKKIKFTVK